MKRSTESRNKCAYQARNSFQQYAVHEVFIVSCGRPCQFVVNFALNGIDVCATINAIRLSSMCVTTSVVCALMTSTLWTLLRRMSLSLFTAYGFIFLRITRAVHSS